MDESRQVRAAMLAATLAITIGACGARAASSTAPVERDCLSDEALVRFAARGHRAREKDDMLKLDLRLRRVVRELESAAAQRHSPTGSAAAKNTGSEDACVQARVGVIVWYTGHLDDLIAAGLELAWNDIHKPTGRPVATGWIAPTRLTELAAVAHVIEVDASLPLEPELNASIPALGVKALRSARRRGHLVTGRSRARDASMLRATGRLPRPTRRAPLAREPRHDRRHRHPHDTAHDGTGNHPPYHDTHSPVRRSLADRSPQVKDE